MLVLSRRKGQRIIIGDIEIVVTAVHRSSVKLGITAPRRLSILRGEHAPTKPPPKRRSVIPSK